MAVNVLHQFPADGRALGSAAPGGSGEEAPLRFRSAHPTVLVVCFRLRRVRRPRGHALFRLESELNTVLFAGFPGLVPKLWLRHDQHAVYRGVYQWDGPDRAVAYVRALWWVLAPVGEPGSIHYALLPGLSRDQVLADPGLVGGLAAAQGGGGVRLAPADDKSRPGASD